MGRRVWAWLSESDLEFVEAVREVVGLESTSESIRFIIRLCRLMLPRAHIVSRVVAELLEENSSTREGSGKAPRQPR